VLELAAAGEGPVKGERIAQAQNIPLKFLENILLELRHDGLAPASGAPKEATGSRGRPRRSRSLRGSPGCQIPTVR
jgi:hypothetical protein